MKEFTYTIKDAVGIHARPAGNLAKLCKEFESEITIEKEGKPAVSPKQLMKLMGLGVKCGDAVRLTFEGADEETAAKAVEEFMNANL